VQTGWRGKKPGVVLIGRKWQSRVAALAPQDYNNSRGSSLKFVYHGALASFIGSSGPFYIL